LAVLTAALPEPILDAEANVLEAELELDKRACDDSVGCTSLNNVPAGVYCGYCNEVCGNWVHGNAYQLTGRSGSQSCCSYGRRTSCVDASYRDRTLCPI
ncbi:hypothetical protein P154DRAFT_423141, partial [Amniculicola lignicola CBS 123094]